MATKNLPAPAEAEKDDRRQEAAPQAEPAKMTIYEYEQKYTKRQNAKGARFALRFAAALIGVFLLVLLTLLTLRVYEINEYVGYGVGGVCLILFIVLFIVPTVKILRTEYFVTNVNSFTAKEAQKHNKKLRHNIADKIIHLTASVDGVGWYDSQVVGRLAIAQRTGDEEMLKAALTELYKGSVKKSAKTLIFRSSMRSAAYSALSQSQKIDAALVVVVNLQLIKDLVFLYGFRPSDAKLVRIFGRVLQNSLVSFGLGGLNIGHGVVKTMGEAVKGIPILGSAIAAIIDSSVQGLTNGTLTAVIGYQTIKYLNEEYRLQNILDGVDVTETQEEFEQTCADLETELKRKKKLAPAV